MELLFDIKDFLDRGEIQNELELERALIADRKLRLLVKEHPELKSERKKLRELIHAYEDLRWSKNSRISTRQLRESDIAERIAGEERQFLQRRKEIIKERLKAVGINQQQLGKILGHNSKSYMSELMNGIHAFTLRDIVIINRLLKVELSVLVPTFLSEPERKQVKDSLKQIDNPNLKLSDDFVCV